MALASSSRIVVDTGPLVAFLRKVEENHDWTGARFSELPAPFLTCEPVLAKTFFRVSRQPEGPRRFFELLGSGLLEVDLQVPGEQQALGKLIHE